MQSLPDPVGEHRGATRTLGGGTDFFVQNPDPDNALVPGYTDQEPDAQRIRLEGDAIVIGSAVTMRDFFAAPEILAMAPGIGVFEEFIASLPIRNRATLAGNIANASPIADMTSILIALGAELALADGSGKQRRLPLADAFIGYKKLAFSEGERIASIRLKAEPVRLSFEKVAKRAHLDIASVNSAIAIRENSDGSIRDARLSFGGVGPTPLCIASASKLLCGQKISAALVIRLAEAAVEQAKPISDVRGSAEYRTRLVYRLVLAHAVRLWPALEEELLP
jgi:xanthine dehydrogenase small subunit